MVQIICCTFHAIPNFGTTRRSRNGLYPLDGLPRALIISQYVEILSFMEPERAPASEPVGKVLDIKGCHGSNHMLHIPCNTKFWNHKEVSKRLDTSAHSISTT